MWKPGRVTLGTDALREAVRGKKLALMMNHTALANDGRNLIDVMYSDWGCDVAFLFGMEHGIRGNTSVGHEEIDLDVLDEKTGLKTKCLYRFPDLRPPVELVAQVDAVVFTAQDAGNRCYTYAPWMTFLMDAAAKAGTEVIVLDRPNPLGGLAVEGAYLAKENYGILGEFPYPLRHGLTIGELAKMYNATENVGCKLTVIPMEGWRREMFYADTGLLWIPASPNIPTPETFFAFSTMVIFEGNNLSHGRGTTAPFYYCGAPWIDGQSLARKLNALDLPGFYCLEAQYQPTHSQFANQICNGIFYTIYDQAAYDTAATCAHMLTTLMADYGEKIELNRARMSMESGNDLLYQALTAGKSAGYILEAWNRDAADFAQRRKPYLLY